MKKWNSETNHSYGMHGGRSIENQTKSPKQSKMAPPKPTYDSTAQRCKILKNIRRQPFYSDTKEIILQMTKLP